MGVGAWQQYEGGLMRGGVAAKVLLLFKLIDLCFGSSVVLILSSIGSDSSVEVEPKNKKG